MDEVWKPIPRFNGLYDISSFGRVRRNAYNLLRKDGSIIHYEEMIKKCYPRSNGYIVVSISQNNHSRMYFIHRLIAEAFIPNPENKPYIDHINTIVSDNRIDNLRWVTHKENMNNELTMLRFKENGLSRRGVRNYSLASEIEAYTRDGKFIARYASLKDAADAHGVATSGICMCCKGKMKSCGGIQWRYVGSSLPLTSNWKTKQVIQADKDGNVIKVWEDASKAADYIGVRPQRLYERCEGGHKTQELCGYKWYYKN